MSRPGWRPAGGSERPAPARPGWTLLRSVISHSRRARGLRDALVFDKQSDHRDRAGLDGRRLWRAPGPRPCGSSGPWRRARVRTRMTRDSAWRWAGSAPGSTFSRDRLRNFFLELLLTGVVWEFRQRPAVAGQEVLQCLPRLSAEGRKTENCPLEAARAPEGTRAVAHLPRQHTQAPEHTEGLFVARARRAPWSGRRQVPEGILKAR